MSHLDRAQRSRCDGFSHGATKEQGSTFSKESEGSKDVKVAGTCNRLSRGFEVEGGFYEVADDSLGPVNVGTVSCVLLLVITRRVAAGSNHGR